MLLPSRVTGAKRYALSNTRYTLRARRYGLKASFPGKLNRRRATSSGKTAYSTRAVEKSVPLAPCSVTSI